VPTPREGKPIAIAVGGELRVAASARVERSSFVVVKLVPVAPEGGIFK